MQSQITFSNVAFGYLKEPLLQKVNLTIRKGEFVGIIGPNGSGKTTLLKMMMGLIEPTLGTIERDNSTIGYVPQGLKFDKRFPISVFELVLSGRLANLPWHGRYSQLDHQKAVDVIEKMGLTHLSKKAFGTLSGGEAQRALIARSLIADPDILFLDEPTASVDTRAEKNIYEILDKLRGKITILMVTHNLKTAIEHVERVLCVEKEVMTFKPDEVCRHFAVGLYHPPLKEGSAK